MKETPELLMSKIQTVIKVSLGIRRDIPIPKVTRMYTGKKEFQLACLFLAAFLLDFLTTGGGFMKISLRDFKFRQVSLFYVCPERKLTESEV